MKALVAVASSSRHTQKRALSGYCKNFLDVSTPLVWKTRCNLPQDDAVCGPWPSSGSVNVIRTKTKPDVDAASIRLQAAAVSSLMGKPDI